jgi:glycosyltransferase involved in cell wall biosynthesis
MAARGHVVELLIPPWDCPHEAGRVQQLGDVRVRSLALGPGAGGFYPRLSRGLLSAVRAFAPDALIGSKGLGYAGRVMAVWHRQGGRIVLDVDDLEDERGWGAKRNRLLRRALIRQEAHLARNAAGVIVASRFLADEMQARHPGQRFLLLPNGLTRAAERARVEESGPVALLLTRGNDIAPERLKAVWRGILAQAPDAHLWIVGDWPDAPAHLPRTTLWGWLDGAELNRVLGSAALCFFLPEDTPLLRAKSPARLLDCIARGLPVAASDVGEYGALVRAVGGQIVTEDDDLVSWAAKSLQSPALRKEQSQQIWQRATTLSWPHRAADLETWLRGIGE